MSASAIDAYRSLRAHAVDLAHALTDAEWLLASDCAGWRVRDVYAHMGAVLHGVVDPAFMRAGDDPNDMEAGMEVAVAERTDWAIADVVAEYETYSDQAGDTFASLQAPELADVPIAMGNLGTHPMHLLADAFVFDAYCHLRNDLIAPFGPLERAVPEPSAQHLAPIMEWMFAGLPQMCEAELSFMDRPVVFELVGAGGGSWLIGPDGEPAATITSTPDAFVRWGTARRPWRDEGVTIAGDEAYGARVADACNVI